MTSKRGSATVAEGRPSITELGMVAYPAAEQDELAATLVAVSALAGDPQHRDTALSPPPQAPASRTAAS